MIHCKINYRHERFLGRGSYLSAMTVGYWPTVAVTGNGELGFDSGEGA